jgi:hypothetical protein
MIALDVAQGSPEWIEARLGRPTASQFHRVLPPKTRKPGTGAVTYMRELLAEWAVGEPMYIHDDGAIERGSLMEDAAVGYYHVVYDSVTTPVGFVLDDGSRWGASPDRLVGDDGGLEIKSPTAKVQVENLLDGLEGKYWAQAQGGLLVTGRAWWDILSFHELLPTALLRVEPDLPYLRQLEEELGHFTERLEREKARLLDMGLTPRRVTTTPTPDPLEEALPF